VLAFCLALPCTHSLTPRHITTSHITLPRHTQPRTPHYAILARKTHEVHARGLGTPRQHACPPARDEQREAVCSSTSSTPLLRPTTTQALPPPPWASRQLLIFHFDYPTCIPFCSGCFLQSFAETLPQAHSSACPSPHAIPVQLALRLLQRDLSE